MERKTSKLIIGGVLVLVGIGLLTWVLTARQAEAPSSDATTPQTSDTSNEQQPAEAETLGTEIVFTNDGFNPRELSVAVGTVVTVRNESDTNVQFSSDDHPTHLENTGMNLSVLAPGQSATFTADRAGEWGFHDHLDDSKTGRLTVIAAE